MLPGAPKAPSGLGLITVLLTTSQLVRSCKPCMMMCACNTWTMPALPAADAAPPLVDVLALASRQGLVACPALSAHGRHYNVFDSDCAWHCASRGLGVRQAMALRSESGQMFTQQHRHDNTVANGHCVTHSKTCALAIYQRIVFGSHSHLVGERGLNSCDFGELHRPAQVCSKARDHGNGCGSMLAWQPQHANEIASLLPVSQVWVWLLCLGCTEAVVCSDVDQPLPIIWQDLFRGHAIHVLRPFSQSCFRPLRGA